MPSLAGKIRERFEKHGLRGGAKSLLKEAGVRVIDANREVILLSLDLGHPKAHRQPGELEKFRFELRPFGPETMPGVVEILERSEPSRIDQVRLRLESRTPGFVTLEEGRVIGYVFYEENTPDRPPHPDLEWLGMRLRDKEVYSFDSFVPPELRGRGVAMFRATYQALFEKGYKAARGYVFSSNTAALWSYRLTGWKEDARILEHRILGRFAVVGGVVYRLNRFDRTRVARLPFADLLRGRAG